MTNLDKLAKQVSLLNRLIELLRMREKESLREIPVDFETLEKLKKQYEEGKLNFDLFRKNPFRNELIQKVWSDELVRVARELVADGGRNETNYLEFICYAIKLDVDTDDCVFTAQSCRLRLEAILNKYGRSLSV